MELLEIGDIADRLNLPVATVRYFRDRFILYIPTVRIGRHLRYPPEAVEMIHAIAEAARAGATAEEIEQTLQQRFPVTVITSQELAPLSDGESHPLTPMREAVQKLGEQQAQLQAELDEMRDALAGLATAKQLQLLRAETAAVTATLVQRERVQRQATEKMLAELRQEMDDVRRLLEGLRAAIEGVRVESGTSYLPEERVPQPPRENGREQTPARIPRRMGQPLRSTGTGPLRPAGTGPLQPQSSH